MSSFVTKQFISNFSTIKYNDIYKFYFMCHRSDILNDMLKWTLSSTDAQRLKSHLNISFLS